MKPTMILTTILLFLAMACEDKGDDPDLSLTERVAGSWEIATSSHQFGSSNFDTAWVEENRGTFTFFENGDGEYFYEVGQGGIDPLQFSSDFKWALGIDSSIVVLDVEDACRSVQLSEDEDEMRIEMVWQSSYRTHSGTRFELHYLKKE